MKNCAKNRVLKADLFKGCPDEVAKKLIGCYLFSRSGDGGVGGQIIETEAYCQFDPAAHCYQGKRGTMAKPMMHDAMYCSAGTIYIYPNSKKVKNDCHLNFVCGEAAFGSGVLVRALRPAASGIKEMRERRKSAKNDYELCNGPIKLCHALDITHRLNGKSFTEFLAEFVLLRPEDDERFDVLCGPRVRVTSAKDWPRSYILSGGDSDSYLSPDAIRITKELGRKKCPPEALCELKMNGELKECGCAFHDSETVPPTV